MKQASVENTISDPRGAYSPVAVAAASLGKGGDGVILGFASFVFFTWFPISSFYGIVVS